MPKINLMQDLSPKLSRFAFTRTTGGKVVVILAVITVCAAQFAALVVGIPSLSGFVAFNCLAVYILFFLAFCANMLQRREYMETDAGFVQAGVRIDNASGTVKFDRRAVPLSSLRAIRFREDPNSQFEYRSQALIEYAESSRRRIRFLFASDARQFCTRLEAAIANAGGPKLGIKHAPAGAVVSGMFLVYMTALIIPPLLLLLASAIWQILK